MYVIRLDMHVHSADCCELKLTVVHSSCFVNSVDLQAVGFVDVECWYYDKIL